MQKLKRTCLVNSKLAWRIWWFLTRALTNLENLHFNELLLTKVQNVWAKKVGRSYFWLHWRLMQNLKKNWLVLPKMTWGFWQMFTRAPSRVWKFGLLLGPFIQNWNCMNLKFTEEWCVMKMKNDAKIEEDLTCQLKIDMRNLTNFDLSTQKSQKYAL